MTRLLILLFFTALPASAQNNCICLKCSFGWTYEHFKLPGGSMKPLLPTGSCVIARKKFDLAEVAPASVIFFEHPVNGAIYVKRVIATEGQTVQMVDGVVVINGTALPQTAIGGHVEPFDRQGDAGALPRCINTPPIGGECVKDQFSETLAGQSYSILNIGDVPSDHTAPFTVPQDHLFVLGDNRDNSVDSRFQTHMGGMGFVPVNNVVGILDEIIR